MNMMNVATALNAGSRTAESGKKVKDSGEVKDDFKKLMQGKEDGTENAAEDDRVSQKDGDQKKDVGQKKDAGKKKDDVPETPAGETGDQGQNIRAAGLFAAYQADQGMRPELIRVDTETAAADAGSLPELAEEPQMAAGIQRQDMELQPVQNEQHGAVQALPAEKAAEEKIQAAAPKEELQAAEVPAISRSAAKASPSAQEDKAQTDDRGGAEQMVQAPVQTARTETVREAAPQETVRMHVPQPEELPEKLTDQLLSKMSDGVREFEIQIEPENLGKIAVKISYENGQANISIFCSEKKALDVLGQNVKEICGVIERNFGGSTTIILDKPENDYLNQARDENGQGRQGQEQEQPKEGKQQQSEDDAEQFLQKLRLGLVG